MQIKKYLRPFAFIALIGFLLQACNLGAPQSVPSQQPTAILATDTATAALLPSVTPSIFAPSNTPLPPSTPTLFLGSSTPDPLATATATFFFAPTATPTQQWQSCPGIVINVTDTDNGDMIHILRCEDGLEHDLGPLAKGFYAVGPNDKFLIYVTQGGQVYGARIGQSYLYPLLDLVTERIFTVFNKGVAPDFKISFSGEHPSYRLILLEKNYDQKRMYELPPRLTY